MILAASLEAAEEVVMTATVIQVIAVVEAVLMVLLLQALQVVRIGLRVWDCCRRPPSLDGTCWTTSGAWTRAPSPCGPRR